MSPTAHSFLFSLSTRGVLLHFAGQYFVGEELSSWFLGLFRGVVIFEVSSYAVIPTAVRNLTR